MMHIVGQGMPRALRGEVDMLEELRTSGLFDEYYARGYGLGECTQWVGRIMSQIADRYPHMKIIEIGAGTGAATKSILAEVGSNFLSYTSTDLSIGFAEAQDAIFSKHRREHPHRRAMTFSVLDVEKDPIEQGYEEGGYDLLVAFGIIHATVNLKTTLRNIRKILRPGGFLVVVEPNEETQPGGIPGFIFGSLPGWWLGVDEGRVISPLVSAARWDELLRATGFSGIDESAPKDFETTLGFSNFVSQAIDDRVQHLRTPLATLPLKAPISDLFIIGGASDYTNSLVKELRQISESFAAKTNMYKTLGEVDHSLVHPGSVVVSLTDLDKPVFQDITEDEFQNLKPMFTTPKTMLWLTTGRRGKEPYSNMTVGFGRSAINEIAGLCLQFLDVDTPASLSARQVSEFVLRLLMTSSPEGRIEPVSQTKYIVLVPSPASVLRVPSSSAVLCPATQLSDGALLALVAAQLVASVILDSLWEGSQGEIVVHNAPAAIAEAIAIKASSKNIKAVFMTDSHDEERQDAPHSSRITIRPYISRSALKKILLSTVSCFVGLTQRATAEAGHCWENHLAALSCLPPHCRRETLNTLFSLHGSESIARNSASLVDLLQHALDDSIRLGERERVAATGVISVADLTSQENVISNPLTVVD
ncbi:hypothetical protein ONZ43_g7641 [Nemania bipapillata]|uniref:Uncharacterized protein n=1 Tax=Nemania bipapillata TaxID=110536 RepID=A0ACC2HPR3_9PEZI|nr:hypothetical protein ONZ43_g7641 [Nemania bipapillata]